MERISTFFYRLVAPLGLILWVNSSFYLPIAPLELRTPQSTLTPESEVLYCLNADSH